MSKDITFTYLIQPKQWKDDWSRDLLTITESKYVYSGYDVVFHKKCATHENITFDNSTVWDIQTVIEHSYFHAKCQKKGGLHELTYKELMVLSLIGEWLQSVTQLLHLPDRIPLLHHRVDLDLLINMHGDTGVLQL